MHTHIPTLHYITLHYITLHYITLHYITLHYITLHYITDIHTLHTYIHAHSDVWFKSYEPVAASDERRRVPTSITAVSKEKESLRPEVDSSSTQVAGVLFFLGERLGRVTWNRSCVTGCISGFGRVRRLDGDALTLRARRRATSSALLCGQNTRRAMCLQVASGCAAQVQSFASLCTVQRGSVGAPESWMALGFCFLRICAGAEIHWVMRRCVHIYASRTVVCP